MSDFSDKNFLNTIFPEEISYGAVSSLKWNTDITLTQSGYEKRISNWQTPLYEFNVSHNVKTKDQILELKKLFYQAKGQLLSFKFKDWVDYEVKESEGVLNDEENLNGYPTFQLQKKYEFTIDYPSHFRDIKLIMKDDESDFTNFQLLDQSLVEFDKSKYELNFNTGIITFKPIKTFKVASMSKVEINRTEYLSITFTTDHNFTQNEDLVYLSDLNDEIRLNKKVFKIIQKPNTKTIVVDKKWDQTFVLTNANKSKVEVFPQNLKFYWIGEFFINVRFAEDNASITVDDYNSYSVPCKLTEIR